MGSKWCTFSDCLETPSHEETRQDCRTSNKTKEQNFGPNKWDFCQLVKHLPEFHAEVFGIVQQSSNSILILSWPEYFICNSLQMNFHSLLQNHVCQQLRYSPQESCISSKPSNRDTNMVVNVQDFFLMSCELRLCSLCIKGESNVADWTICQALWRNLLIFTARTEYDHETIKQIYKPATETYFYFSRKLSERKKQQTLKPWEKK